MLEYFPSKVAGIVANKTRKAGVRVSNATARIAAKVDGGAGRLCSLINKLWVGHKTVSDESNWPPYYPSFGANEVMNAIVGPCISRQIFHRLSAERL